MKQKNKEFSAYRICWAEFIPMAGRCVTVKDIRALNVYAHGIHHKTFRMHFATKENAVQFIKRFDRKLTKRYKVLLCTDRQFGLARMEDGYEIKYTKKQIREALYVG